MVLEVTRELTVLMAVQQLHLVLLHLAESAVKGALFKKAATAAMAMLEAEAALVISVTSVLAAETAEMVNYSVVVVAVVMPVIVSMENFQSAVKAETAVYLAVVAEVALQLMLVLAENTVEMVEKMELQDHFYLILV